MMQLRIEQQYAQIGIQSERGQLQIQQRSADVQIQQRPVDLGMHTEQGQIYIDQTKAFADAGLKSTFAHARDYAAMGQRQALQKIAQLARDGERMADIHIPSNAFASMAKRDSAGKPADFDLEFIPKYGSVKIDYRPTETTFNVQAHQAEIHVRPNQPTMQYRQGGIEFYLRQKNSISFDVVGENVNTAY